MKTFQDGDPLFGAMMNAIANLWPNGTAVLSGNAPTGSGSARQVTVAAGSVVIGGTVRPVSQQTKTLDAAAFDRYDLLSVNSSGTVVVTKGTEERRVPALPANSVPIAICLIEVGQTTLPADRIHDARLLASQVVAAALMCSGAAAVGGSLTVGGSLAVGGNATFSAALWAQYGQLLAPPSQDAIFRIYQDNSTKCVYSSPGNIVKSVTVPSKYIVPGSVYVKFNHSGVGVSRIYVNGIVSITSSGVLNDIKGGDVIGVNTGGDNENQGCNSLFEIYAIEAPASVGVAW